MTVIDMHGTQVRHFLRQLLANSVDKLKVPRKALYSCMLNPQGGVIDDLIAYYLREDYFRFIVNAATREKDLTWIHAQATPFKVRVEERANLAMIAIQGPNARAQVIHLLPETQRHTAERLGRFTAREVTSHSGTTLFISRTGYTGEDGFEILLPQERTSALWNALLETGVKPIGLVARDTLRLEAGMNLYGQDMDEQVSLYEAALGWTVMLDEGRHFIRRRVLEQQKATGVSRQMIGVVMDEKGVLRHGQKVLTSHGEGEILSGTFSPTLKKAIGFARVPAGEPGEVSVNIRDREVALRVVTLPFVREGQTQPSILD